MGYLQALQLMVRAYKAAKGVMPKGLDLLKMKMKARQKAIDSQKVVQFPKDKITPFFKPRPRSESEAQILARMNRQNKEAAQRLRDKKKPREDKANGGSPNLPFPFFYEGTRPGGMPLPSLDYYDDDAGVKGLMKKRKKKKKKREDKAGGGITDAIKKIKRRFGKKSITTGDKIKRPGNRQLFDDFKKRNKFNVGGMANISQTYDNNPTLQSQFPNKQDYLDLFSSTTTTTPQTQTYAQMTQQSPAGIPAVKPIVPIIPPQGDSENGGGGITSTKRNKNFDYETEAYGINPTGLSKDVFDYEYAAANANKGIFETLKQFSPTYQFMKAGKQLKAAGQKAIEDYFARKEAEKIAAAQLIAQQNIQQGSSGGPGEGAGTFGASINEATGARGPGTGFSDYS